ncbi:beta strand repeat-containing protein, partial [Flavobacterium sp.]|uniref:beta strand repeat-containing protein n=1 Tax=Flavobacterium sp. TaxID=239 RepID=UPI00345B4E66
MKNKFTLLFLIFLFANSLFSQNLIVNGGFELGGSGIGFVTNGAGYTLLNSPYSGTTTTGNFAFATNPNIINSANFIQASDHTTGNGKMLIIDGNMTAGNPRFWKAGNTGAGITTLTIGTTYRFSYWIQSASNLVTGPTSQADIRIQVTGASGLTLVAGTTLAPLPALGWRHVVYSFTATATTATIELWNNNTTDVGNDFAVDDFMLTDDLMVTYNVTNALCASANDGSITVNGIGGTLPYTNYNITGPVTQNSPTGIFPGVPPGIYTVSVTDSSLPTATTVSMGNVVVGPFLTITSTSAAVCIGSSTTLSVTGSSNPYTWTAAPADPSLTTPNSPNPTVTPTVTTVYTVSSTIGACTVTKSITITVNPLPVANITGNITICPGNTATFLITGTPNSTVTLVNNLGNSYSPFVPASGTLNWNTPILNATTVYTLVSVKSFATFCQRDYTGVIVTITVVPNGCATVATQAAPGTSPLDLTLCTTGECRTLQANVSPVPSTSTYAVTSIPFCPQAAFENPSWINIGPGSAFGDDDWSCPFTFPAGMNFCFYGQNYQQLNVGTNQVIHFPYPTAADVFNCGDYCPWPYNTTIPNAGFPIKNAIFGVYQDTDFSVVPPAGTQISVNYQVIGTYPCRKFVANFTNCPQFSCGNTIGLSTSQIVLYEVSNIIEVYVQRRVACTGWNGGRGTIGVIDGTGLQAVAAPGRNAAAFSTDPTPSNTTNTDNVSEAWRFTPTGPPVSQTINWYVGPVSPANFIGTGPTIQVCPAATTTYTLETVFNVCGVLQTASNTVTLNVNPDLTNAPLNITQCTNTFDLTSNASVILGSLNPSDYDITYHLSAANAATVSNPIANPSAFVSAGQTIYVAIYLNSYGCTVVKPFNLIISCGAISPVPDLTLCESSLGSGTAVFNLTPQTAIALGSQNATDYTFTYYLSQAAANAGTPGTEINPINSFVGTNQTLYIRMQSNVVPTTYYTTDFDLIVSPMSNAGGDGSINICDGDTTPINLFTLITGEQTGGTWVRTTGTGGTFNAAAGTFTPSAGTSTSTFTYTLTGVVPCANDSSLATVNIIAGPNAGTDGGIVICATSSTPIDLFSLITGEQTGGTWVRTTGTGGIFNAGAGTFAPTAGATTSTFTYTVPGIAPCGADSSLVTVTIGAQPNAGVDGGTVVCETSTTPIDLFSLITGEQPGGVWTRITGTGGTFNAPAGTYTPAIGATSSTFTYTIVGIAPCITDSSLASVSIVAQPTAGVDGGTVVCETSTASIDLFSLITGEQTGGTWVRSTGTGGVFNAATATYTPAVGATTSTFTYTVAAVVPCSNDSSVATITINPQPNAGTDGGTVVCETSVTAINLFSLITGEQSGGVWTQTTGSGGTFNAAAGTYTPAVGATSSTFTYTLTGIAPCINDTSLATVTINPQPTAGGDGGTAVCENSIVAVDLFSLITGEQTGGTWVRTTGLGGIFNAVSGTYTPAIGATTSTFTYTVTGIAPCINDSSVATITVNPQPTSGNDGGTVVCETSVAVINLFSLITGEQTGGVWTRTSGSGGTFNAASGTFTPAVGATTSIFTYTVIGIAPCINDTSLATITINPQPNAGVDGGTVVCETSIAAVDLFSLISGEQTGGTWVRTTGTGGTFNSGAGTYTPAVGATNSTFTYTLIGVAPCTNDSSLATITINLQPTAGTDGGTTICGNDSIPINLYTLITGEQTGGTWTRTTGTGGTLNSATGIFTPALGVTTSTFTYTVIGTAPCINDSSIATIIINPLPTATISGTTAVCLNAASPQIIFTGANGTAPYTFTYSINTVAQPPISTTSGNSVSVNVPTTPQGAYTYALVSVQDGASPACSQTQTGSAVVTVNTAPTINNPTPYVVCDDSLNNDGLYCFNLVIKNPEISTDPNVV